MCWSSRNRSILECKKVAQEDVPVRKIMMVSKTGQYLSYFREFIYALNVPYSQPIEPKSDGIQRWGCKTKGFHSYDVNCRMSKRKGERDDIMDVFSPNNKLFLEYYSLLHNLVIVDCIIPKGTTYYVNENGEYVSENIIIVKETDTKELGIDIPELVNNRKYYR